MSLSGLATRLLGSALAPLLPAWLRLRARRGKEVAQRLAERRGLDADRPEGPLLWLHGASLGESLSLLPLMEALSRHRPELRFLVTTGTVTAATMLQQRLSPRLAPRVTHRFVPLDVPRWVDSFLTGWRPDGAVFVESELWPNLTAGLARRGIPMVLVNASLSSRSARLWRWLPGLARDMLGRFALVVAQSEADAGRLRGLGARDVVVWGNLKAAAPPLPADPGALAQLRAAIGARPVFLAASTHPGEDEVVIAAHLAARQSLPRLLTVIVPRHPQRGAAIAALAEAALAEAAAAEAALAGAPGAAAPGAGAPAPLPAGMPATLPAAAPALVSRRSEHRLPDAGCEIHVADTLGELGLFFRLAGLALVGASLVPKGGHNPLEAARLGCPIVIGPHTEQFEELVAAMEAGGGLIRVQDRATLAEAVKHVLSDPRRAQELTGAAGGIAAEATHLPERLAEAILRMLPSATGAPPDPGGDQGEG